MARRQTGEKLKTGEFTLIDSGSTKVGEKDVVLALSHLQPPDCRRTA
jgi:hypothetical protein